MDSTKAPPIQYLKTFVIAAKHMSFKEAAHELHLTPSAISQQVRSLEKQLLLPLFNRDKKQLSLTRAGVRFLSLAEHVIQEYEVGFQQFIKHQQKQPFKVSCTTYLANQYLIPNLASFNQDHPKMKLALQSTEQYLPLEKHGLDAAIRFTAKPDANAQLISPAYLVLACSPDYSNNNDVQGEINWSAQSLIHCRPEHDDWWHFLHSQTALTRMEYEAIEQHHFDSYEAGIQAAKSGLGITFATLPLAQHEIEKGELLTLAGIKFKLDESFYLITRNQTHHGKEYRALLDWIKTLLN